MIQGKINMSRSVDLVKNTFIVAIGKLCTKFISFFLLPFYTAVLSAEEYGIVDLFNTYVSLLLPIIVFQIEDALFRFSIDARENKEEEKTVISTVLGFCVTQCILFVIIFSIIQNNFKIMYGWYLLANLISSVFCGAMLQLSRGMGDNVTYALASFLNATIAIILNIVFVLGLQMGAEGLFLTAVIVNIITIFIIFFRKKLYQMVGVRWFDRKLLKRMLRYSIPLVPNYLSWWVIGASDRTVVSYFLGIQQNGFLSVAQKFSTAYTNLYGIFNLTWTENASVHEQDKDMEVYYSGIIEKAFLLLASACMMIIAVMPFVFSWLVNIAFKESYYQIPIYMISSLLYSIIGIYSVVYVAKRKTKSIAKTSVIAAVINLATNLILIQYIGLYAASISSVLAYGIMFIIRWMDIRKMIRICLRKWIVLSVGILLILDIIVYYSECLWLNILNLVIIFGYAFCVNKDVFIKLFCLVKTRRS